jgi:hypothetical protein
MVNVGLGSEDSRGRIMTATTYADVGNIHQAVHESQNKDAELNSSLINLQQPSDARWV